MKKNRFNIATSVDVYKTEFLQNAKTTFYKNVLDFKNLGILGNNNLNLDIKSNGDLLALDSINLFGSILRGNKESFLEGNKTQAFPNDFLYVGLSDDKTLKQNIFKKNQIIGERKTTPIIDGKALNARLWSISNDDALNNFFQNEIITTSNSSLIQHPDLDDETRTLKRNSGKNTPIRVLKSPNSDFFFINSGLDNIELFRFRFNEKKPTLANKPIRPTLYLTFKQKRYNQRTNISKKTTMFFDKDLNKQQTYSGNPFLKDSSIIEENYGNPTRQYRMLKKAKSRVDSTRVGS